MKMAGSQGVVRGSPAEGTVPRAPSRLRFERLLPSRRDLLKGAAIAATYYGAAKLGLALAFENSSITAVWPPTGIALAALVLCGRSFWPAVALGAFFANSWTGVPLITTVGITVGNTLEALAGTYLLLRVARFRPSLDRVKDVLALVALAAIVSTMVSATLGVTSLWLGGEAGAGDLPSAWRLWWLGDMGGDLIVAPLLFALAASRVVTPSRRRLAEGLVLVGLLCAVSLLTFSHHAPLPYLTFPLLAWSALRFGLLGATTGASIVAVVSVWFTSRGMGPFAESSRDDSLLLSQTFVGVASAMSLVLAAFVAERSRARAALQQARDELQLRVQERSATLAHSERQLHQVLETAHEAFVSIDARGLITAWNPQAEMIFGWARSEALGRPLAETVLPARYREAHRQGLARFLSTGEGRLLEKPIEMPALHRDGHEFPVELTISPLKVGSGYVFNAFLRDISDRKRAEQELKSSQASLAVAQQIAHLGSWEWDIVTGELTWSDEIYRILGLDRASVDATPGAFLRCVHPGDRDRVDATLRKAVRDGSNRELEYRIRRPDGEVRVLHGRGEVVTDVHGRAVRMFGTALDVTEQKRLEEESSRFWNLSLDMLAISDFEFNAKRANPAHRRILGYSEEEMKAGPWLDLVHPDDRERVLAEVAKLASADIEVGDIEGRVRCRDGSYRTVLCSARSDHDKGLIYTVAKDITERKRAEEAERLAAIVESSEDGIISTTLEGTIRSWNPGAERLYGYSPGETEGHSIAEIVPPDRSAELAQNLASIRRGRSIREYHTVRLAKGGRRVDVSLSVSPIRDENGRITGASAIHRDISSLVRAKREKDRLQGELDVAHRLESIGQLAGGVAHDFNNILAVIMNYARFVADEVPEGSRAFEDLEEIRRAADRAAALTRQLLIFGRRDVVVPQVLSVNAVVSGLDTLLASAVGEHVDLQTRLDEDILPVKADAGQIEQVLINLVVNARDAMPDGGELTIETANVELGEAFTRSHPDAAPGRYVRLTVRDTGTGMHDEVMTHAFEPFFTTKPKGEGTGLGLATVYGIVRSADGIIDLDSTLGRGTSFQIYLPAVLAPLAAARGGTEGKSRRAGEETVLVVEDEVAVREMAERILRNSGYSVLNAGSGQEALEICARGEQRIDLLLTDVIMPEMLGTDLARQITGARAGIRILYMSGYGHEAVEQEELLHGAEFIEKPFTAEGLLRQVRGVLDSSITATLE
jgi:PAS domain S-box-containing protein